MSIDRSKKRSSMTLAGMPSMSKGRLGCAWTASVVAGTWGKVERPRLNICANVCYCVIDSVPPPMNRCIQKRWRRSRAAAGSKMRSWEGDLVKRVELAGLSEMTRQRAICLPRITAGIRFNEERRSAERPPPSSLGAVLLPRIRLREPCRFHHSAIFGRR